MLSISIGGRISELLSLTISDVYQNVYVVTDLLYNKSIIICKFGFVGKLGGKVYSHTIYSLMASVL